MSSIANSNAVNIDVVDHSGPTAEISLSANSTSQQFQHSLPALRVESATLPPEMSYQGLLNQVPVLFKNPKGQVVKITLPATDEATSRVMTGLTQAIENGLVIGKLELQDRKALITGEMITPPVWNSLSPLGQSYLLSAVKMSMSRVPNGSGYGIGPDQHRSNISSALAEARSMSRVWDGLTASSQAYMSDGLNQASISNLPLEQQHDTIYRLLSSARNISINEQQQQSFRDWIRQGMPAQEALARAQDTRLDQVGGLLSGRNAGIASAVPGDNPRNWDLDAELSLDQINLLLDRIKAYELTGQADIDRRISSILNDIKVELFFARDESRIKLREVQEIALAAARKSGIALPKPIQQALGFSPPILFTAADFQRLEAALNEYALQNPGPSQQNFMFWVNGYIRLLKQHANVTFADVEEIVQITAQPFNITLPESVRQALTPPVGVQRAVRLFVQQNNIDLRLLERLTRLAEYGVALAAAYRSEDRTAIDMAKDAFANDLTSADWQNILPINVVNTLSSVITKNSTLQNTISDVDQLIILQQRSGLRTPTIQYLLQSINIGLNF